LKRTLKGIAAVSVVLGTLAAPTSAFAATHYNTTKVAHESATALKSITVTKTESFTVTIKDSHNKAISGALVSFSSSNTSVATVSPSHVVTNKNGQATVIITGHKAGSATLKVTVNGKSYSYKVTVTQPAAPTVSISGLSDGQMVATATHTVTVTSNEKSVSLYLNGKRQSGNGPTFHLTLAQGTNTITAVATNEIGQTVKKSIHVTLGKLAITGAPTNGIGIGQKKTLSLTDAGKTVTSGVTWSVDGDGAVIDQKGNFIASSAGTYTVTATYDGQKATVKVVVFGKATKLQLNASSANLVANGVSMDAITIEAVDANGNVDATYDGTVNLNITGNGGTLVDANGNSVSSVTFTNGVATVYVKAPGSVPATPSDTITATATGLTFATTTVNYVAQVATSLQVTPASKFLSSQGTGNTVALQISALDQTGNPMNSGTFSASVSLTGPATFTDGTKGPLNVYFNGTTPAVVYVQDEPSETGSITVTASASGLKSGNTTITEGTPGAATGFTLALPSSITNNTVDADTVNSGIYISGTVVDANGFTAESTAPSTVSYTISRNGQVVDSNNALSVTDGTFTIPIGSKETTAGTYTVTVSGNGLTSKTLQFTVTPGAAANLSVTPAYTLNVPEGNPTTTIKATVTDNYGNTVAKAGQQVNFWLKSGSSDGAALNNNTNATSIATPVTVYTDGTGSASVTLSLPSGLNKNATVEAYLGSVQSGPSYTAGTVHADSATVNEVGIAASKVEVTADKSSYVAGSTETFTITPEDTYGDIMPGDHVIVTVPSGLFTGDPNWNGATATQIGSSNQYDVVVPSSGSIELSGTAGTVGTYKLSVTDESSPSTPTGSASVSVTAGDLAAVHLFDTAGNDLSLASTSADTVDAGSNVQLVLKPVDANGNVVASDASYTVNLPQVPGLAWRTSLSGSDVSSVTLAPGQTSVTLYLVNSTSSSIRIGNGSGNTVNTGASGAFAATPVVAKVVSAVTAPSGASATIESGSTSEAATWDLSHGTSATTYTVTFTLVDQNNKPLANQAVKFDLSGSTGTKISSSTGVTDSAGKVTITYTVPAGTNVTGTDTISVTDGALAGSPAFTLTLNY
jgi:hypothetical protein